MKIKTQIANLDMYRKYLAVVSRIEDYLQKKGYLKLDLPVLTPALIPEGYLEIFKTNFQYLDQKENLFLTPSPELFIKRLLAAKIGDCYYLGKSFRNSEPSSPKHQPEFTMLEMYKVGEDYKFMAGEVLGMLVDVSNFLFGKKEIFYQGKKVSFAKFEELTVAEAFAKYAGIMPEDLFAEDRFLAKAAEKGYQIKGFNYEDLWSQIYTQEVEPRLGVNGYPTVLFDYPLQFAALASPNKDGLTAQRFEFYIEGVELGNCYSELTDPKLQKIRFQKEDQLRKDSGKIEHPVDWDFIKALEKGMPECTGIAIGIDRIGMIFTDAANINDLKLITIE